MPPGATASVPPCLLCRRASTLPPGKAIWISAAGIETLAIVCTPCDHDCGNDAELEAKIAAKVSGEPPAPSMAAE